MIQLLEEGVDVFVSDIDAIWLKSPFPDLNTLLPTSQIVSSRGSFPKDLSGAWGFTLCMGFIYIQASPMSLTLFRHVLHHMLATHGGYKGDDQYSINQVLFSMNIRWKRGKYESQQELNVGQVQFSSIHRAVVYENSTENSNNTHRKIVATKTLSRYDISVLPDHRYLRRCIGMGSRDEVEEEDFNPVIQASLKRRLEHAVVAHCLIMTSTPVKQRYLQTYSLWKAPKMNYHDSPLPSRPSSSSPSPPFIGSVLPRIIPSPSDNIAQFKREREWAYDDRSNLEISTGPANGTTVEAQMNVGVSIRRSSSVVETRTMVERDVRAVQMQSMKNRVAAMQREAYLRGQNEKRQAMMASQVSSTDLPSTRSHSLARSYQHHHQRTVSTGNHQSNEKR
eukprot:scaffold886_cov174-Ochromonas_danica.AAC.22